MLRMSDTMKPDVCIIGDSPAGLRAALLASAFGAPTVLVKSGRTIHGLDEARHALMAAANHAQSARQAGRFGIRTGDVAADCAEVMARVRAVRVNQPAVARRVGAPCRHTSPCAPAQRGTARSACK